MMIFTILGIIVSVFFFIVIMMTIIEGRIKRKSKEKLLWKMDKVETKINVKDKVVTRTGGLENDRLNERQ